jgi:hypothetical protein
VVLDALEASRRAASASERAGRRTAEAEAAAQRDLVKALGEESQRASADAEQLRASVARLEARTEAQRKSIKEQSRREVRRRLRVGLAAVTVLGIACVLVPELGAVPESFARILKVGGLTLAGLGVITLVFGGSLKLLTEKLEEPLVRRRERQLRGRLHLPEEEHGATGSAV